MSKRVKNADAGRTATARRRLLLGGVTAIMLLLTGRAFHLQVLQREKWSGAAEQQQARQRSLPAPRGTIYDRDGVPLAASEETFTIGVAPGELRDRKQVQRLLQKHAG